MECDNKKAHSGKSAKKRDMAKDKFLEKKGWVVLRFSELAVQYFKPECIKKIKQVIRAKGGVEAIEKDAALGHPHRALVAIEEPLEGAHGTLVTFLHPKDTGRVLWEWVQGRG